MIVREPNPAAMINNKEVSKPTDTITNPNKLAGHIVTTYSVAEELAEICEVVCRRRMPRTTWDRCLNQYGAVSVEEFTSVRPHSNASEGLKATSRQLRRRSLNSVVCMARPRVDTRDAEMKRLLSSSAFYLGPLTVALSASFADDQLAKGERLAP